MAKDKEGSDCVNHSEARTGREVPARYCDERARCDACGSTMKPMGHCKYVCLRCGFLRTCNDVI
jgi:hypothetical protein